MLIAGPTASGKSALALALAEELDGVIINADSMQIYRDLRILTARPSPDEEARVPHRLYGHVDAAMDYSVGRYITEAADALARAEAQGRLPILVGGTGLYFKGLTRGLALDFAPTRVNTVSPGIIDTPLWDRMSAADKSAMYAKAAATLPARRIGQPQDVGQAILFLMTNPFATGSVLHLDGGSMLL